MQIPIFKLAWWISVSWSTVRYWYFSLIKYAFITSKECCIWIAYSLVFRYRRMQSFEHELCTTVDAILDILVHKPRVTFEQFHHPPTQYSHSPKRPQRIELSQTTSTARGPPKLVKSKSEIDKLLENVWINTADKPMWWLTGNYTVCCRACFGRQVALFPSMSVSDSHLGSRASFQYQSKYGLRGDSFTNKHIQRYYGITWHRKCFQ